MANQLQIIALLRELGGTARLCDVLALAKKKGMVNDDLDVNHIAQRVHSLEGWGMVAKVGIGTYQLTGTCRESKPR